MSAHHHVIPIRVLGSVFGALVLLTVITVLTAQVDLGVLNMPLALAIASAKALLVVMVFMALRWDNRVNALILSIGGVFVLVFLALTLSDTALRGILDIQPAGEISPVEVAVDAAVVTPEPETEAEPVALAPEVDDSVASVAQAASSLDGEAIFIKYLCNTCHSFDGSPLAGPTLQAIGERQTRDEIIASIKEPDAIVIEGYTPGVMAATLNALQFDATVTSEEFEALVDWIVRQ